MARGVAISDEVRALVIAELMTGAAVNATARKYKLGRQTVSRLRNELGPEQLGQVGTEKRRRIDDLLHTTVANHLSALDRIAAHVSTAEYLREKSPEAIAALYREFANTTLSILEAASAAGIDDTAADDGRPAS